MKKYYKEKTGVYAIINLTNGKMIIGSGVLIKRKSWHFRKLEQNKHCNPYLQKSYNKNGEENFVFELIEYCEHRKCIENETFWVNFLDTKNPNKGYNIETPGKGRLGVKASLETREKMSKSMKGKNGIWMKGRKTPQEVVDKRVKSREGYIHSEETKEKLRKSNSVPRPWTKGIKKSEEHKRKISESCIKTKNK